MDPLKNASESFARVIAEASMHLVRTGDKQAAQEFIARAAEALAAAEDALAALDEAAA